MGLYDGIKYGMANGLYKGVLNNELSLFSGYDLINLSQPKLYFNLLDKASYVLSGATITQLKRYKDSGLNTNTLGTSEILYSLIDNKPLVDWTNSATTAANSKWTIGNATDFSFCHVAGGVASYYLVFSSLPSDDMVDGGSSKLLFATANTGSSRGFSILIRPNSDGTRQLELAVQNGSTTCIRAISPSWIKTAYTGVFLLSFRVSDANGVGNPACQLFVNGEYYKSFNLMAAFSATATQTSVLQVGNRAANDSIFRGRMGMAIISNSYHDEGIHSQICTYIMKQWGINRGSFKR